MTKQQEGMHNYHTVQNYHIFKTTDRERSLAQVSTLTPVPRVLFMHLTDCRQVIKKNSHG